MAFSQSGIADVRVIANGPDLFVAWSGTAPAGTTFQVYVDRTLAWSGTARRCHVPIPALAVGRNVWIEVGAVAANEPARDYSASLIAPGDRTDRAVLNWTGGTYLDPTGRDDIEGFRIYQGATPGGPPGAAPVAAIAAYPGGWINDGFGKGGFGAAGFGRAATAYQWTSASLAAGTWNFAVVPVARSGNARGDALTVSLSINAAPRPPALGAGGSRLGYTNSAAGDGRITLHWLPSATT